MAGLVGHQGLPGVLCMGWEVHGLLHVVGLVAVTGRLICSVWDDRPGSGWSVCEWSVPCAQCGMTDPNNDLLGTILLLKIILTMMFSYL